MSILNQDIDYKIVLSDRFFITNAKDRGPQGMCTLKLQHEYVVLGAYLGQAEPISERTFICVTELRKCLIRAAKEYFKWYNLKSINCKIKGLRSKSNQVYVCISVDFGEPFETREHKMLKHIDFEYLFKRSSII